MVGLCVKKKKDLSIVEETAAALLVIKGINLVDVVFFLAQNPCMRYGLSYRNG